MPTTCPRPHPDTILAQVQVLRLTDLLLSVAENLRTARDRLHTLLEQPRPEHNQRRARYTRPKAREGGHAQ